MKILLTGAAGFTGRHFSAMAQAVGHQVIPLQADLTDRTALRAEVLTSAPDAVVHLAGISFAEHEDDSGFYAIHAVGTSYLLSVLCQLPRAPNCVLLASSAFVYGNCDASPIVEDQPPAPLNHYAASKLAMEHIARTFSDRLPIVIVRPFNYTGVGQDLKFVIPKLVNHFARRAPSIDLGNLHVEREFNDVRMVCSAYLQLLVRVVPGETYNVCSGQPYTLQQVIEMLSKLAGHRMAVKVNPAFVRANELHRLCGSPSKLHALVGRYDQPSLVNTLHWMLRAARDHS